MRGAGKWLPSAGLNDQIWRVLCPQLFSMFRYGGFCTPQSLDPVIGRILPVSRSIQNPASFLGHLLYRATDYALSSLRGRLWCSWGASDVCSSAGRFVEVSIAGCCKVQVTCMLVTSENPPIPYPQAVSGAFGRGGAFEPGPRWTQWHSLNRIYRR